jgi:PAS domain S-box-containing protein
MKKELYTLHRTRDYVKFLINSCLDELGRENLRLLIENEVPLLKVFAHLSPDQLLKQTLGEFKVLLEAIVEGKSLQMELESIRRWQDNELKGIERGQVTQKDIILIYSIRKQVLLHFLPQFTSDCALFAQIMQEWECYYTFLTREALDAYEQISKEHLLRKNKLLSTIIDHSVQGIYTFDKELRVTEWNKSFEKRTGISRDEIVGKPILAVFPQYEQSEDEAALRNALKGEQLYLSDREFRVNKGWYESYVLPLFDSRNEIIGGLTIVNDITERKLIELKLKEHQEELEAANEELHESLTQLEESYEANKEKETRLLEAQAIAHLGNWQYNLSQNTITWSDEMRNILGYGPESLDVDSDKLLQLVHPEDRTFCMQAIREAVANKKSFTLEHRICRPDGQQRWVVTQGHGIYSDNHRLSRLRGTLHDITERKEAELVLAEERYFIQSVADTSPDIITVYDLIERRNIYANKELFQILGYTTEQVEELRSKGPAGLVEILHPEDLRRFIGFIEEYKTYTGNESREIEIRGKNKEGEYIWVMSRYNVFKRSADGLPTQIIGITRDITFRKEAEAALQEAYESLQATNEELCVTEELLKEANDELEDRVRSRTEELYQKNEQLVRINADLDNFIYTASHDLKAPISNLEGLINVLNKKARVLLDERDGRLLDMVAESIERLKKTITDLTEISRMQKDMDDEQFEVVDVKDMFEAVRADLASLIYDTGARFNLDIQVEEVMFSKKNFRSVLYNLLTNAIKYKAEDRLPLISIQTRYEHKEPVLLVSDNGVGIPSNQKHKIFSLFKRLHTHVEGSGIGLYLVKRVIENNNGRVEVHSQVGEGTTFKVYFKENSLQIATDN